MTPIAPSPIGVSGIRAINQAVAGLLRSRHINQNPNLGVLSSCKGIGYQLGGSALQKGAVRELAKGLLC